MSIMNYCIQGYFHLILFLRLKLATCFTLFFYLQRDNLIHWSSPCLKLARWQREQERQKKKRGGEYFSVYNTGHDWTGYTCTYDTHANMIITVTWLWFFMTELPNMKTHHGSHCMGGTPTQYLSTASASDDFSSSYVRSHRTLARYLRDLLSFWWRHAWRKQVMADTPSSVFLKWK